MHRAVFISLPIHVNAVGTESRWIQFIPRIENRPAPSVLLHTSGLLSFLRRLSVRWPSSCITCESRAACRSFRYIVSYPWVAPSPQHLFFLWKCCLHSDYNIKIKVKCLASLRAFSRQMMETRTRTTKSKKTHPSKCTAGCSAWRFLGHGGVSSQWRGSTFLLWQ